MCPAVIVVVIAVDPLHIGLVIHIFIQHRSFQYLLCFYYSWKGEKAVEKDSRKSYLSGVYIPVEGGTPGCVWRCGYGCVADRPLDKCYML